jgi:hypothetical protein
MSWAGGGNRWTIGTDGTSATGGTALNYGPTAKHPTAVFLPTGSFVDSDISKIPPGRLWGPSSQHAGGIVNHVYADAHVEAISDQIDPNVYLDRHPQRRRSAAEEQRRGMSATELAADLAG